LKLFFQRFHENQLARTVSTGTLLFLTTYSATQAVFRVPIIAPDIPVVVLFDFHNSGDW
jgi:hypothetical protein